MKGQKAMLKKYDLNDKITVSFDADDTAFAHRVFNTLNNLNRLEEEFTLECKTLESREVFKIASQTDAAMRKELDALFDVPVCTALFGNTQVYARSGGTPLWFNFIECIINTLTACVPQKYRNILKKYRGR